MQNPNNDNLKATGQMDGSGAGVLKDKVTGAPNLGNGVKGHGAVKGAVDACRYYDSDGSDLGDDGEIRAKGPKRAGLPYPTQHGPPVYPPHYANPQQQSQGGHAQQPARGQPHPSTQAQQQPLYAQRPPQPTPGYGQGGQYAPSAAPHTAQQQQHHQQQRRPYYAPPPPGGQSHAGYPHTGGYPQAGHPQASAASHYPAATQRPPAAQKPAPKKK